MDFLWFLIFAYPQKFSHELGDFSFLTIAFASFCMNNNNIWICLLLIDLHIIYG